MKQLSRGKRGIFNRSAKPEKEEEKDQSLLTLYPHRQNREMEAEPAIPAVGGNK